VGLSDTLALIHPFLAVAIVFPTIGITAHMAWQTRQRRLQVAERNGKSPISPIVGREHVRVGRWLTGLVTGVTLVALAYALLYNMKIWTQPIGSARFVAANISTTKLAEPIGCVPIFLM